MVNLRVRRHRFWYKHSQGLEECWVGEPSSGSWFFCSAVWVEIDFDVFQDIHRTEKNCGFTVVKGFITVDNHWWTSAGMAAITVLRGPLRS